MVPFVARVLMCAKRMVDPGSEVDNGFQKPSNLRPPTSSRLFHKIETFLCLFHAFVAC